MYYQEVLKMFKSTPYLFIGLDVGTDFAWMSIMFLNGILIGKPLKIIHSDPQFREFAISKVKEVQGMYSLESRRSLESTEIYHIPLLYFLRNKGLDCAVTNPIITKNSTNINVRKPHNNKFGSKKATEVDLDASLEAPIVPDDAIIDPRNLVHDCYYFKDLQSVAVLRLHAELRVSFPAYPNVFSKVIAQASLKLLGACPLAADIFAAPKDELVEIIRSTACFGEMYALARYDAVCTATKDTAAFGRTPPNNTLWIRLYIKMHRRHQTHLDSIPEELHQAVGRLEGTSDYDCISFTQTLHGIGFLSAVVLTAEMGPFDLFSSPKKLYVRLKLDPGVSDSDKFHEDRVHVPKRGSSLVRRVLHTVAANNLKMNKATKTPVNPVIYDYYTRKYASKKKSVTVKTVMHETRDIIFATLQDNKPFELTTPEGHRERHAAGHPESVSTAA